MTIERKNDFFQSNTIDRMTHFNIFVAVNLDGDITITSNNVNQ